MVVTIKEHRYDVDFDDVRVIAAADDGKRAIVEAHASLPPVTDAGYGKRLIDFLDVVKAAIDGVVGDGVSAECFGAAYNWRDILTGWLAIVEASTASAAETRAASTELVHRATACVIASKASGRQPVRLE